jgi:hypothetical protein
MVAAARASGAMPADTRREGSPPGSASALSFATSASLDPAESMVVANVDQRYRDLAEAGKAHIDAERPTTRPA